MFFELQELRHLRRENAKLSGELKTAQAEIKRHWAAQKIKQLFD